MNLLKSALHLFFPPICGFCGKINEENLCEDCRNRLQKKEKDHTDLVDNQLDEHFYMFFYEGEIRDKLLDYKFLDHAYLAVSFAKIMTKNKKICQFLERYDIMCPVPIHPKRQRARGYNQSALLARQLVKEGRNSLLQEDILIKVKNTKPQSSKTKKQRQINVQNAYKVKNKETIKGKNILLLDDIYTTGNTAKECAKILKKNGASKVGILTIAKDK